MLKKLILLSLCLVSVPLFAGYKEMAGKQKWVKKAGGIFVDIITITPEGKPIKDEHIFMTINNKTTVFNVKEQLKKYGMAAELLMLPIKPGCPDKELYTFVKNLIKKKTGLAILKDAQKIKEVMNEYNTGSFIVHRPFDEPSVELEA